MAYRFRRTLTSSLVKFEVDLEAPIGEFVDHIKLMPSTVLIALGIQLGERSIDAPIIRRSVCVDLPAFMNGVDAVHVSGDQRTGERTDE
jgi:hypothetical protein